MVDKTDDGSTEAVTARRAWMMALPPKPTIVLPRTVQENAIIAVLAGDEILRSEDGNKPLIPNGISFSFDEQEEKLRISYVGYGVEAFNDNVKSLFEKQGISFSFEHPAGALYDITVTGEKSLRKLAVMGVPFSISQQLRDEEAQRMQAHQTAEAMRY